MSITRGQVLQMVGAGLALSHSKYMSKIAYTDYLHFARYRQCQ